MPTGIGCRARAPLIARAAGLQTPQACVAHMIVWACGVRSRAVRRARADAKRRPFACPRSPIGDGACCCCMPPWRLT
eukprot:599558-Prymnesium_polylepis.1